MLGFTGLAGRRIGCRRPRAGGYVFRFRSRFRSRPGRCPRPGGRRSRWTCSGRARFHRTRRTADWLSSTPCWRISFRFRSRFRSRLGVALALVVAALGGRVLAVLGFTGRRFGCRRHHAGGRVLGFRLALSVALAVVIAALGRRVLAVPGLAGRRIGCRRHHAGGCVLGLGFGLALSRFRPGDRCSRWKCSGRARFHRTRPMVDWLSSPYWRMCSRSRFRSRFRSDPEPAFALVIAALAGGVLVVLGFTGLVRRRIGRRRPRAGGRVFGFVFGLGLTLSMPSPWSSPLSVDVFWSCSVSPDSSDGGFVVVGPVLGDALCATFSFWIAAPAWPS